MKQTKRMKADDYELPKRCEEIANYIIEEGATVRSAASIFGISKSTVHKDVTQKLKKENPALYRRVKKVLDKNKAERHLRGGAATKKKYLFIKQKRSVKDGLSH